MPSSTNAYTPRGNVVYHGDLAPLFTIVENRELIYQPAIALCIGNGFLRQLLSAETTVEEEQLLNNFKDNYIDTLEQLFLINIKPDLKIIVVIPPYDADPAMPMSFEVRDNYHSTKYRFMQSIANIIKNLPAELTAKVIFADMTSSINPFDSKNYAKPTELSSLGVGKVQRALDELLNLQFFNLKVKPGKVYRFTPDFLSTHDAPGLENEDYIEISLNDWQVADPADLKANYSFGELEFFKNKNLATISPHDLLTEFHDLISHLPEGSAQFKAACLVHERAIILREALETEYELKNWKISMGLALEVLKHPSPKAFKMLDDNARTRALGKNDASKLFTAALVAFVGCVILAVAATAASAPVMIGAAVAGSLFCVSGLTMFYKNIHLSNKSNLASLADAADVHYNQELIRQPELARQQESPRPA